MFLIIALIFAVSCSNNNPSVDVTAEIDGEKVEFTAGSEDSTGKVVTVTLTGATFANATDVEIILPNAGTKDASDTLTLSVQDAKFVADKIGTINNVILQLNRI